MVLPLYICMGITSFHTKDNILFSFTSTYFNPKTYVFVCMERKLNSIVSTAWARVPMHAIKFCNAHDAPLTQSTVENTLI